MRISLAVTIACIAAVGVATASDADAAAIRRFTNISARQLGEALQVLAEDRDLQMIYRWDVVGEIRTQGAVGELTFDEAMTKILSGTSLTYRFLDEKTVTILPIASAPATRQTSKATSTEERSREARRTWRLAQANSASSSAAAAGVADGEVKSNETSAPFAVEEIIVTAQKRSERLEEVPVPVTAISAEVLTGQSEVLLRDYYAKVPGLIVSPAVQTNQTVAIRGITTGTGNPTVAILIDDISYGASTNIGGGRFIPEIDPGDLARVEVLRGPQGTLYGASSLGGLLKFVTRDPSTKKLSGTLQGGMSAVRNGEREGYNVRGSINVPLSDAWAIRASAFTRRDPGYVDNIRTGEDAVNQTDANGGRLSAFWQPSETFSLKLNALLQELKEDGQPFMGIGLPDLQQSQIIDSGWTTRKTRAYSATLNAKIGNADLISLSGYTMNDFSGSLDIGDEVLGRFGGSKFSQEIRLSMPLSPRFVWLLGVFYTDEDSNLLQTIVSVDPVSAERRAVASSSDTPTTFREYAAFTHLTVHFTDRFDVQLGVREAWIKQTFGDVTPESRPVTYLVTPRLRLSPDLMIYGRLASGYRPGGGNVTDASSPVPPQYESDKTQNYELGVKGDFFGDMLSIDASVYYIDWKDIQFNLLTPPPIPISYTSNGSRAHSQGVELAVGLRPLRGLTIDGWVVWSDAVLTEDFPPLSTALGASGDRLPFSSRFSGHLSVAQEFPLWGGMTGVVSGALRHVGERVGSFRAVAVRQIFPEYDQVDVRAGVRKGTWSADLYATNVGDERGALGGGLGALPANALIYIRPRTVGLSFTKDF